MRLCRSKILHVKSHEICTIHILCSGKYALKTWDDNHTEIMKLDAQHKITRE